MPTVTVDLPAPLRRFVGGASEIEVEGEDLSSVLDTLRRCHPDLARGLLDGQGRPRRFVRLFLNEVDTGSIGGLEARVEDRDRLTVLVAMAGG